MPKTSKRPPPSKRIALYRKRAQRAGISRVEVAVPAPDVPYIRAFARVLREGGDPAERLRVQGVQFGKSSIAQTGDELVSLLRQNAREGFVIDVPARKPEPLRDTGF